jgi:uncharacterized protein
MPDPGCAVRDNARENRLEISIGDQVAFAEYQIEPNTITFTHTRVPEGLRGKGLGTQLIKAGLLLAQARRLKVISQCPFFAAYIRAHPKTAELAAPAGSNQIGK